MTSYNDSGVKKKGLFNAYIHRITSYLIVGLVCVMNEKSEQKKRYLFTFSFDVNARGIFFFDGGE
jgi:hypothetical protein